MENQENRIYVTRAGLPLRIELEWPYHRSVSGADFYVLHATVRLGSTGGDASAAGSGQGATPLHALVAVQLTLTVRQVLASLEPKDSGAATINTIRKAVDGKELEFLKTPKRVPVPFNSRTYDFKRHRWAFGAASDAEIEQFLARRIYWESKGAPGKRVHVADAVDAQYLDTSPERLAEAARALAVRGQVQLEGEWAVATSELMSRGAEFESLARRALEELEKKHAFERG